MTELVGDDLLIEDRGPIRILTLDRPEDRNPASTALLFRLTRIARELAEDGRVRAVILTGAGRAFSAGGDFLHFVATANDPAVARETIANGRDFITAMLDVPVPVIAAVNGAAVGFGATLLALSDIVIMAENAFIIEPHVNVGLVIGDGISITWPFLASLHKAKELAFTGDRLLAADAVACGLANKVVPPGEHLNEALAMAERIVAHPRSALAGSKRLFNMYAKGMVDTVLKAQMDLQFAQTQGPDHGRIVQSMIDGQNRNR
ncbi:enoyl-CoA hydratase/isomerase family protein [Novosphingobium ginsenosidimutans]|uniref:Enoyl-CoA hydratase/isomerase family protein n=1 Tax=Novosphingobium ginsenosidimutans TaxID=1176536 RepID=A0A5B8S600_9SPHN|nr:enoyl-CoA hydratase/isomerase family protein [Novosphingobium ginsenosidimutans]QEA17019.1 enoyl-CoA hydratase/isomerase family protein [Novosphingobium ginsenosidimutans]